MRHRLFCLSLLAGVATAVTAQAQSLESTFQRDKNVSVTQRPRPGYEAIGIRAGSFLVYPKVTADVAYEDNVFYETTNEKSDTIYSLRPVLEVQSNWSRHQIRGVAQANLYKFDKYSGEDNETYSLNGSGRIDVVRGTAINLGGGYESLVEARFSPTVQQFASEPVRYDRTFAKLGASREVNRLRVSGELRYSEVNFDDTSVGGVPVDLSYRDHKIQDADVRVDYALSPALALYVYAAQNNRDYAAPTILADVERDSKGWEAAVGADFEITNLARGQVQVGYLNQTYDAPNIGDVSGVGLRARLEWFPTQLATVTFSAERTIEDTGVIGAAGILRSSADAKVDYELLRNLIVTARLNWQRDEYRGLDRQDDLSGAMLGLNYLITRNVGVFGQYNFQTRSVEGLQKGVEFDANRFQVGLVLQY